MVKLTLEQQNNKNYLVGRVPEGGIVDEDCLATVSEESAGEEREGFMGVVPVIYSQIFQERTLKYDINAYLPLAEYKARVTGREQLCSLFLSIIDTCQKAESYLLDTGFFLLEEEYVYVNASTGKAFLILYPIVGTTQPGDLQELFSRMLKGIRLAEEDMGFYGEVAYELNYADSFNIVKFKEVLSSRGAERKPESSHKPASGQSDNIHTDIRQPQAPKPPVVQEPAGKGQDDFPDIHGDRPEKAAREKKKEGGLGSLFGGAGRKDKPARGKAIKEKSLKEKAPKEKPAKEKPSRGKAPQSGLFALPDEEVGASSRALKPQASLDKGEPFLDEIPRTVDEDIFASYARTADEDEEMAGNSTLELFYINEKRVIRVGSFPFEIGREGSGCRIDPSKGKVSRRHAVLQREGDHFQICDVSKLGTTINGKLLPKDTYVDLTDGMRIDMKGEIFEVRIIET